MDTDDITVLGVGEERDPAVLRMLEQAEWDAEREGAEVRVNFRWGSEQLALVREAASMQGVPYQVYIKKALYDRAKADIAEHYQLQALRRGAR